MVGLCFHIQEKRRREFKQVVKSDQFQVQSLSLHHWKKIMTIIKAATQETWSQNNDCPPRGTCYWSHMQMCPEAVIGQLITLNWHMDTLKSKCAPKWNIIAAQCICYGSGQHVATADQAGAALLVLFPAKQETFRKLRKLSCYFCCFYCRFHTRIENPASCSLVGRPY